MPECKLRYIWIFNFYFLVFYLGDNAYTKKVMANKPYIKS